MKFLLWVFPANEAHNLSQNFDAGGKHEMDMQLIRESIEMEQPVGTGRSQATVEGDVTLPGGLREETHVLSAHAMAVTEGAEALQDRANVSGRVIFHVLYTQGDPKKVNAIEAAADFTHLCEMPGAQPRAAVTAQAQVERVEARVTNGRMTMKATLGIAARAALNAPVEAIVGVNGSDDVELRTQEMTLRRTVAQGSGDVLLREEFDLPAGLQITETLYATACPTLTDVSGGLGRVGLSGQVALEAVHASSLSGRPVVVTRHSIPLTQSVEIAGEDGEHLDGRITVKDVAVASQDMGDGERTLRAEVLLGLEGWADREETISVMADAYTTQGDDLRLTSRSVSCRTGDERCQTAESAKTMLLLPESAPPVRSVLTAFVTPVATSREQTGGRMTVSGNLLTTLLYMTDDSDAPVSVHQEAPFRTTFAAQAGEDALVMLTAGEVDAAPITSDRVELRYILRLTADGVQAQPLRLVTDAQEVAAEKPTEDIVLYFTQPGETLWDIARRYRLPVQGVKALNPELNGDPRTGQGVVVWRRSAAAQV